MDFTCKFARCCIFCAYALVTRCWTQGKPDKLVYLRKAKMWYLSETCSPLEALVAQNEKVEGSVDGPVYTMINNNAELPTDIQWDKLSEMCCSAMDGAP